MLASPACGAASAMRRIIGCTPAGAALGSSSAAWYARSAAELPVRAAAASAAPLNCRAVRYLTCANDERRAELPEAAYGHSPAVGGDRSGTPPPGRKTTLQAHGSCHACSCRQRHAAELLSHALLDLHADQCSGFCLEWCGPSGGACFQLWNKDSKGHLSIITLKQATPRVKHVATALAISNFMATCGELSQCYVLRSPHGHPNGLTRRGPSPVRAAAPRAACLPPLAPHPAPPRPPAPAAVATCP